MCMRSARSALATMRPAGSRRAALVTLMSRLCDPIFFTPIALFLDRSFRSIFFKTKIDMSRFATPHCEERGRENGREKKS